MKSVYEMACDKMVGEGVKLVKVAECSDHLDVHVAEAIDARKIEEGMFDWFIGQNTVYKPGDIRFLTDTCALEFDWRLCSGETASIHVYVEKYDNFTSSPEKFLSQLRRCVDTGDEWDQLYYTWHGCRGLVEEKVFKQHTFDSLNEIFIGLENMFGVCILGELLNYYIESGCRAL